MYEVDPSEWGASAERRHVIRRPQAGRLPERKPLTKSIKKSAPVESVYQRAMRGVDESEARWLLRRASERQNIRSGQH